MMLLREVDVAGWRERSGVTWALEPSVGAWLRDEDDLAPGSARPDHEGGDREDELKKC